MSPQEPGPPETPAAGPPPEQRPGGPDPKAASVRTLRFDAAHRRVPPPLGRRWGTDRPDAG